jgi:hypothetical protein
MIRIEITDPHTLPAKTLMDTAGYLMRLAGAQFKDGQITGIAPVNASPANPDKIPEECLSIEKPKPAPIDSKPALMGLKLAAEVFDQTRVIEPVTKTYVDMAAASIPMPPPVPPIPGAPTVAEALAPAQPKKPMIFDTSIELDSNMLPWDQRIHSRTKSKNADGAWKLQRGVDMKLVEKVTQELYDVMAIPVEPPKPKKDAVPPPPASDDPMVPASQSFHTLITKITQAVAAGKLNQKQVLEAVQAAGIPSLPLVATRPDLVPQISASIDLLLS